MKVKWGVMGAGGIARRRTIPEVVKYAVQSEIVALMDAAPDVSQEVGKEFGIGQCYSSVEELLRADIEAVYVASPVFAHAEQVKLALQAGKHVLCEKPMALNLKESEEMANLAEQKGRKLGVAFMMRFHVYHRKIKEMVSRGLLGQIVAGRAQLTCWYPPLPGAWRQVKNQGGGGALMDMGCHCIDLLEWIIGPSVEVTSLVDTITHSYEVEDTSTVLLKFQNGAQGVVDNYFNVPDPAAKNLLEIYGTSGAIYTHNTIGQDPGGKMWIYREEPGKGYNARQSRVPEGYEEVHLVPVPLYSQEFDAMSQWMETGEKPEISYEVGLRNFKVLEAAYQAAKEKRTVKVS